MRWAGDVVYMGEIRNPFNILIGKPEGKGSFWRLKHRWGIILK
jgi:hypothetical protein